MPDEVTALLYREYEKSKNEFLSIEGKHGWPRFLGQISSSVKWICQPCV